MNKEKLDKFLDACDSLSQSQYIQSSVKIKELLAAVSDCPEMMRQLSVCLRDFDFNLEFKASVYPVNQFRSNIRYPDDARKFVAFIFTLLYRLDDGAIGFADFLSVYYYEDEGIVKSYLKFIGSVIPKFKRASYVLMGGTAPDESREAADVAAIPVPEAEEMARTVAEAVTYITSEPVFAIEEKEEMLSVIQLFSDMMRSGVKSRVRAAYTGMRFTCYRFPSTAKYIYSIYGCLKRSGLLR